MPTTRPHGVELNRNDSGELFALLDRVRLPLRAPPIESVCVSSDCNAAIFEHRRFFPFARGRRGLVIGLTLMKTLTDAQLEAVVAHELAHLERARVLGVSLMGRLQRTLTLLSASSKRAPHWVARRLLAICGRYLAALRTAHLPLARASEHEADRASAQVTSPRTAAQALTATSVVRSYLIEKYWPQTFARAKDSPQPDCSPYANFDLAALAALAADLARWQGTLLATGTAQGDTHPSLQERLAFIDALAEFAPPSPGRAADRLLGSALAPTTQKLDMDWRRRSSQNWQKLHLATLQQRQKLQELRAAAAAGPLDEQNSLLHAALEESVGAGGSAALTLRVALRERFPNSLGLQFALGRQLLQDGNADGIRLIENVVARDPNALVSGAALLCAHFTQRGEPTLAEVWRQRHALGIAAQKERQGFQPTDAVTPHGISLEIQGDLVRQLRTIPHLERAYLVKKHVHYFPQYPIYVLGFSSTRALERYDPARATAVAQAICHQARLPGRIIVVNVDSHNRHLARKFNRVVGAQVV
jgi:Zn-dependent protease with chaperone function